MSGKIVAVCLSLLLAGCTEVNCPLDSVVAMTCGLYDVESRQPITLTATLSVRAAGTDSILLNEATNISSFLLPVRHGVTTDTLLLDFSTATSVQAVTDTLFVEHTNEPHFEYIDCPGTMFHTLKSVRWTSHDLLDMPLTVDSVAIVRPSVNYDDIENLRIFLRALAE